MKVIEIISKFYDNHSLSIVSRNLATYLDSMGIYNVCITPLDSFNSKYKLNTSVVKQLKNLESKNFEAKDVDIQIRHSYPPIWRWPVSNKTKVIFIQPWEYSKVPFEWQYKFETFADALITPSRWSGDRFLDSGLNPEKLFILPNGFDNKVFHNNDRQKLNKFTFTYVGNHQFRKGLDIMLQAWVKAFSSGDNCQLIIKDNPNVYGQNNILNDILKIQYRTKCAKIRYIDDDLSDDQIGNLYRSTDVIVHPYRGEGFGMHIQEAMACGAYPLVSSNGPTDDFVTDQCGDKITVIRKFLDLTQPDVFATKPGDSLTLMGQHAWIDEPDIKDLTNKLYKLYNMHNREEYLSKVNDAILFPWEKVVEDLSGIIETIAERPVFRILNE